jgi:hypothetical protein
MSAQLIVPEEVVRDEAMEDLGMLLLAVGVPPSKIKSFLGTFRRANEEVMHWEWRDE